VRLRADRLEPAQSARAAGHRHSQSASARPLSFTKLTVILATVIVCPAFAEQKKDFAEASRAAVALGQSPTEEAIADARRRLRDRKTSAQDIALRRLLVFGLGRNPHPDALTVIEFAMSDPDPGVRIAALSASGKRCVKSQTALLEKDPWPEVRRAALESQVACQAPGVHERLVARIFDRALSYDMREHAAELFAGDATPLAKSITRIEEEAHATELAHPLLRRVIAVMSRQKLPAARGVLLRIAENSPVPGARAEAVLALSRFCDREALVLLEKAQSDPEREVALASRHALGVCKNKK
jgi:HEAT repeat protein